MGKALLYQSIRKSKMWEGRFNLKGIQTQKLGAPHKRRLLTRFSSLLGQQVFKYIASTGPLYHPDWGGMLRETPHPYAKCHRIATLKNSFRGKGLRE